MLSIVTISKVIEKRALKFMYASFIKLTEAPQLTFPSTFRTPRRKHEELEKISESTHNQSLNASSIIEEHVHKHPQAFQSATKGPVFTLATKILDKSVEYSHQHSRSVMTKLGLGIVTKFVNMSLLRAFSKIQEKRFGKVTPLNIKILRFFMKKEVLSNKEQIIHAFNKWRAGSVSQAFTKGRITNKVKGRLLLMLAKSSTSLSKETAFTRWKVKSDPRIIRRAVEKFIFSSKLNTNTAIWRIKSILDQRKNDQLRRKIRLENAKKALHLLENIAHMNERRIVAYSFSCVERYQYTLAIRKKSVLLLQKNIRRCLIQSFERWKQQTVQGLILELRRRAVKTLLKSADPLKISFYKWKDLAQQYVRMKEKQLFQRISEFINKLNDFQSNQKRFAWQAIKSKLILWYVSKNIAKTLKYCHDLKRKRALSIWKENLLEGKMAKNLKVQKLDKLGELLRMKNRLSMQKFIFASKLNLLSEKHKFERLALNILNTLKTQQRNAFKIWQYKKEVSKNLTIAKDCQNIFSIISFALLKNTLFLQKEGVNKRQIYLKQNQSQLVNHHLANCLILSSQNQQLPFQFGKQKGHSIDYREITLSNFFQRAYNRQNSVGILASRIEAKRSQLMRDTLSRFKAHLAEDNKKRLAAASQILTKGHQVYISAFKTWKNKTQQEKIRNSEKAANELFKVIEQGLRENTYPIYQAKIEGRVKTEAFRKILNTYNSIQQQAILIWKQKVQQIVIEQEVMRTKKKFAVEKIYDSLTKLLNKRSSNFVQTLKEVMNQKKSKDQLRRTITKSIYFKLRSYFFHWKKFPKKSFLYERNGITLLDKFLTKNKISDLQNGFHKIKRASDLISQNKKQAIQRILLNRKSNLKFQFFKWKINTNKIVKSEVCNSAIHLFSVLSDSLRENLAPILYVERKAPTRERLFKELAQSQKRLMNDGFSKWRNFKECSILEEEINLEKKKFLASQVERATSNLLRNNFQFSFTRLYKRAVSVKIKQRALAQLSRNQKLKLLHVFKFLQRLPKKRDVTIQKASQIISPVLSQIRNISSKIGFDGLKYNLSRGREVEKWTLKRLQNASANKMRDALEKWREMSRQIQIQSDNQNTLDLFETLYSEIILERYFKGLFEEDFRVIFQSYLQQNRKISLKMKENLLLSLNIWKLSARTTRLQKILKEGKTILSLEKLGFGLQKVAELRKRKGLAAFIENKKKGEIRSKLITILKRRVFDNLTHSIERWKRIPTKFERQKKYAILEICLAIQNLTLKRNLQVFNRLRSILQKNIAKRQASVSRLVQSTKAKKRTALGLWAENVRNYKNKYQAQNTTNLFELLTLVLRQITIPLFEKDINTEERARIAKNIIVSSHLKRKMAFNTWHEQIEKSKIIQTSYQIQRLRGISQLSKTLLDLYLREVKLGFDSIENTAKDDKTKRKALTWLKRRRLNYLSHSFQKWKKIPKPADFVKHSATDSLENALSKAQRSNKIDAFSAIKSIYNETNEKKKKALTKISTNSFGKVSKAFLLWAESVKSYKIIKRNQSVLALLELLSSVVKDNLAKALEVLSINRKKLQILKKINTCLGKKKQIYLNKWKFFTGSERLHQVLWNNCKVQSIERIESILSKSYYRSLLIPFRDLDRLSKEKNKILHMISSIARYFNNLKLRAFHKWRGFPSKKKELQNQAVSQILNLLSHQISFSQKTAFDRFKEKNQASNILGLLILSRINQNRKSYKRFVFNKWCTTVEQERNLQLKKEIYNLFDILNSSLRKNLNPLFESDQKRLRKLDITRRIVRNSQAKMKMAFYIWHDWMISNYLDNYALAQSREAGARCIGNLINQLYSRAIGESLVAIRQRRRLNDMVERFKERMEIHYRNKLIDSWQKWKDVLDATKKEKAVALNIFEMVSEKFRQRFLNRAFRAIQGNYFKIMAIYSQLAIKIVGIQQRKQAMALAKWKNILETEKSLGNLAACNNLFDVMLKQLRNNVSIICETSKKHPKQEQAIVMTKPLEKLMSQRMNNGLSALKENKKEVDKKKGSLIENLEKNAKNNLKDAFNNWKEESRKTKRDNENRAAFNLMNLVFLKLRENSLPIFGLSDIIETKKNALTRILNNFLKITSEALLLWKRQAKNDSNVEKAFQMTRFITIAEKSREHTKKMCLAKWRTEAQIARFVDKVQLRSYTEKLFAKIEAATSILKSVRSHFVLKSFLKIQSNISNRKSLSQIFSKIEERLVFQKGSTFSRIKLFTEQKQIKEASYGVDELNRVFNNLYMRNLFFAISKIKEVKTKKLILMRVSGIFNKMLTQFVRRWQNYSKNTIITALGEQFIACDQSYQETKQRLAQSQYKIKTFRGLSNIFEILSDALEGSQRAGFGVLLLQNREILKKVEILKRIIHNSRFKQKVAIENWRSHCTEKLLKIFYDVILMEKSMNNYVKNMMMVAFHRIRENGLLAYWRTYNNALWKWKLANVEARYYTKQNRFIRRSKALVIFNFVLETSQRNYLRGIFNTIKSHKEVKISAPETFYRIMDSLLKRKKLISFHELKLGSCLNQIERQAKSLDVTSGLIKLSKLIDRNKLKERSSTLTRLSIYQNSKAKVERLVIILQAAHKLQEFTGFSRLKSNFSVKRTLFSNLKVNALKKFANDYERLLISNAFSQLKSRVHLILRRTTAKKTIRSVLSKFKGRPILRKWFMKARLMDQRKSAKLFAMVNALGRHRQAVLKHALKKWSFKQLRINIEIMIMILSRALRVSYDQGFSHIVHKVNLSKHTSKILGVQRILKSAKILHNYTLYTNLKRWQENAKNYNPWFKRAIHMLAKNSKINYQVAFWRLRDASKLDGTSITATKIVKIKKMTNILKKVIDLNIAKAFWTLERHGIEGSYVSMNRSKLFGSPEQPQPLILESGRIEYVTHHFNEPLKNILKRTRFTDRGCLQDAFRKWKVKCGFGQIVIARAVQNTLPNHELDLVMKFGALNIIVSHIKALQVRKLKSSFDFIYSLSEGNDGAGSWRREFKKYENQELLAAYNEKNKELDEAYKTMALLHERLNAVIARRFIRTLEEYRKMLLSEAFNNIQGVQELLENYIQQQINSKNIPIPFSHFLG